MNRLYQISKTLPSNLEANRKNKEWIEFVLVDFASTDGLQDWVLSNFRDELKEGFLQYLYTDSLKKWHAPIAKNTAHYYARGKYLVNLDCDNLTGEDGGSHVLQQFQYYGNKLLYHQFDGDWHGGSYGRIGMHRNFFHAIGGYDELLEPMGHEDMDLINRLHSLGLEYKQFSESRYCGAIRNTRSESVKYCSTTYSWEEMETRNVHISRENIYAGRLVANHGIFGIRNNMHIYKNNQLIRAV